MANREKAETLQKASINFKTISLNSRQLCHLELLINGAFSPLTGFLDEQNYLSVINSMRLADGTFWPMPVTLDVTEAIARGLIVGDKIALRDEEGFMVAVLTVESIWKPDKEEEANEVLSANDISRRGVNYLFNEKHEYYLGGPIEGVHLPIHRGYSDLRRTPEEVRQIFAESGWRQVIAFQTFHALHRLDKEFIMQVAKNADANVLIHHVAEMNKSGAMDHYTRIRCLQALVKHFPPHMTMMNILPLASLKKDGPREALWHAIIEKNYGCSHVIINEKALDLFKTFEDDLGIEAIPARQMVYVKDRDDYHLIDEAPQGAETLYMSESELKKKLREGREIPAWFSYKEVIDELRKAHPPKYKQGFTLFFTGFSGSGKSTIANIVLVKLLETTRRPVTLLDGDIVRKNLSGELNFSKKHRDINIYRIGFVANEITKNGGICICAPIAPYEKVRKTNRELISASGGYIEIHVNTPIEVCEQRDRKGLYAKVRAGIIKGMTGIDDPYEVPKNPEMKFDTTHMSPEEVANEILLYLEREGYIR